MYLRKARYVFIIAVLFLLGIYSLALVYLELTVSQEFVRTFVQDIRGPSLFYAVNTTLCVTLLWGAALIFGVCLVLVRENGRSDREVLFFCSQVLLFAYLGLDDRFRIHEMIGVTFGFKDSYYLLALGLIEAFLLLFQGRVLWQGRRIKALFVAGGVCFAVMIVIDGWVPREAVPRLSLEKLSKTWGCLFLFLLAWETMMERVRRLKAATGDHRPQAEPVVSGDQ